MGLEFGSARNETVWQPEPQNRGTYGLLSTCTITMILCVWTAVHLNLPEHPGRGHGIAYLLPYQTLRKMWWLLLGLFAPELVSWTAFEQHREARFLYNKVRKELSGISPCSRREMFKRKVMGFRGRRAKERDAEEGTLQTETVGLSPLATNDAVETPEIPAVGRTSPNQQERRPSVSSWMSIVESNENESPTCRLRHEWTMTHSYYAIMGGFAFDSDVIGDGRDFLPDGRKRVTLTGKGVVALLRIAPHLFPDISEGQIRDKSKANQLVKGIVSLQALWFAAQCISRMALGMTISLLELNTFAHAICALVAYSLWWHKPLDVEEPTLVQGPDADLVCAGMCMRTDLGSEIPATDGKQQYLRRLAYRAFDFIQDHGSLIHPGLSNFIGHSTRTSEISSVHEVDPPAPQTADSTFKLYMGQSVLGFEFRRKFFQGEVDQYGVLGFHREHMQLSSADILRVSMAGESYSKYPIMAFKPSFWGKLSAEDRLRLAEVGRSIRHLPTDELNWYMPWFVDRVRNLPGSSGSWSTSDTAMILSLFVAGLAYGGLHLLAWNPPVRTATETLIWRASGVGTIAYGTAAGVLAIIFSLWDYHKNRSNTTALPTLKKDDAWSRVIGFAHLVDLSTCLKSIYRRIYWGYRKSAAFIEKVWPLCVSLTTILYSLGRIYLVVECFISVGRLPEAVFKTPAWAQYIPHLS